MVSNTTNIVNQTVDPVRLRQIADCFRKVIAWPTGRGHLFQYLQEALEAGALNHPHLRKVRSVIKETDPKDVGNYVAFQQLVGPMKAVAHLFDEDFDRDWNEAEQQERLEGTSDESTPESQSTVGLRYTCLLLAKILDNSAKTYEGQIEADTKDVATQENEKPLRNNLPKKKPQECQTRAAESYEWVCKARPELIPTPPEKYSRKQWEYIRDHGCPAYDDGKGGFLNPPSFGSWTRQVRGGKADPNAPKVTSRVGRDHGKSIAHSDQL